MDDHELLEIAQNQIRAEGAAVTAIADQINETFIKTVRLLAACAGRIYITGAGTSGAIAYRTAHLMATCGIPAFYIPPGDALHGEAALLAPGDILIALSKAGKSVDINQFASIARQRGATVMCWTAQPQSELALMSHIVLVIETNPNAEGEEILPFGSTLAQGALGDALTLMVKKLRGFDLATLSQTHPLGGANDLARQKPEGSAT